MKDKLKKIIRNPRIVILIVAVLLAIFMIRPAFDREGVAIRSVVSNSSADLANPYGIMSPGPNQDPIFREVIKTVNQKAIKDVDDYYDAIEGLEPGEVVSVTTETHYIKSGDTRKFLFFPRTMEYKLTVRPKLDNGTVVGKINKTFEVTREENITLENGTVTLVNRTYNETREVDDIEYEVIGTEDLGLRVYDAPKSNLRMGLDLQGGTRAVLRTPENVTITDEEDIDIVIENLQERLNVYGLKDLVIRSARDREGNLFIIVEIAGATEEEVQALVGSQGKFEAKIGNETVFTGGEDITDVCKSADCAFVENPRNPCGKVRGSDEWVCTFQFSITLSPQAARRQAGITSNLDVIQDETGGDILEKKLDLMLDDTLVKSLQISAGLRGKPEQNIAITGPGRGATYEEALADSAQSMKQLQTILQTGKLPFKLEIESLNTVSPNLGKQFINNALLIGLAAIIGVIVVIFIRYRSLKIVVPMATIMVSEVILLLGTAALIKWNLDLASIAGIIITVGTGVDHFIMITDETMKGERSKDISFKEKIKRAFGIIMVAYFTTATAMIFLFGLGAGLLRGFAVTTIIGISWGVFVARPAYGSLIEIILND